MVGAPDRIDMTRPGCDVPQEDAAAIVGPQRREAGVATAGPVVAEVSYAWEADHVDCAHMRRHRKRLTKRSSFLAGQFFDVRKPLPSKPQQKPHAKTP